MRFLFLLLFLMSSLFAQDQTPFQKLIDDLDSNDPKIREAATAKLIEQEDHLEVIKSLAVQVINPEVKWRLISVVTTISSNQKFRSLATVSKPITLKFEGLVEELFSILSKTTGHRFDTRSFGNHKVKIDCTDAPLFEILDSVAKQIDYDWIVTRFDAKGNRLEDAPATPTIDYVTVVELTAQGLNGKLPNSVTNGYKIAVDETSFSINNKFGKVITETALKLKHAQDPGIKSALGPILNFTKIVNDRGIETINRSASSKYALFTLPPDSKSVSVAGKARFRIPMHTITVTLDNLDTMKTDANGNASMTFAEWPNFVVKYQNGHVEVHGVGHDNLIKERFTGTFALYKKDGTIVISSSEQPSGCSGYISLYEDHMAFYVYGNSSPSDVAKVVFGYVSEYRDISFDFKIDDIPLY